MQAVVCFNCLGDKCLSHAKQMSTALTQLLIFRFSYLLTNKGSAHVLTSQTNLYKLQLFFYLLFKSYTYVSRPSTILIYVTITYLHYHVSVSLCINVFWSLLVGPLSSLTYACFISTYIGSMNANFIYVLSGEGLT